MTSRIEDMNTEATQSMMNIDMETIGPKTINIMLERKRLSEKLASCKRLKGMEEINMKKIDIC